MAEYYVSIDGDEWELGETDLFGVAEALPGSAFLSEASAAAGKPGKVVVKVVGERARRLELADAIARHRINRPGTIYQPTLAEIEVALRADS